MFEVLNQTNSKIFGPNIADKAAELWDIFGHYSQQNLVNVPLVSPHGVGVEHWPCNLIVSAVF